MDQPDIPLSEFARRLCVAAHPAYGTTGQMVPCGQHTSDAQRLWGLLGPTGTSALGVIYAIRAEQRGEVIDPKNAMIARLISIGANLDGDEEGLSEILDDLTALSHA